MQLKLNPLVTGFIGKPLTTIKQLCIVCQFTTDSASRLKRLW